MKVNKQRKKRGGANERKTDYRHFDFKLNAIGTGMTGRFLFLSIAILMNGAFFGGCFPDAEESVIPEPRVRKESPQPLIKNPAPLTKKPIEERIPAMDSEILAALVEVKDGSESVGSAFVAKWNDKHFIITNMHVLSGNRYPAFILANDKRLYPKNVFGAVGHDVAIIEIDDPGVGLQIAAESTADKWYGLPVLVPGNSLGGGVFNPIIGTVTAVGAKLVEVDARFVSGNSGSPIILFPDRQVVGVATFTRTVKLRNRDQLSKFEETRWFGYRLDSIKFWQAIDGPRFLREAELISRGEKRLNEWINHLVGKESMLRLRLADEFSSIQDAFHFRSSLDDQLLPGRHPRRTTAVRRLFLQDTKSLATSFEYDYHENFASDLLKLREFIADLLESIAVVERKGHQIVSPPSAPGNDPFAPREPENPDPFAAPVAR